MGRWQRGWAWWLVLCAWPAAAGDRVRLGYSDNENFPNQMGIGVVVADPPGVAVELIIEAARAAGVDVELVRAPAARLFMDMQTGALDGAFVFSYKDDRRQYAVYPQRNGALDRDRRIATINYHFYALAHAPVRWDGKALTGWSDPIGINQQFSIGEDLQRMGLPLDQSATSTAQNFEKLRLGRTSAYATLDLSADMHLHAHAIDGVVKLQPPIVTRDYYVVFSHAFVNDHGGVAERLWDSIGELRDVRGAALLRKYVERGEAGMENEE